MPTGSESDYKNTQNRTSTRLLNEVICLTLLLKPNLYFMKTPILFIASLLACTFSAVASILPDDDLYRDIPFDMPQVVRPSFPDYEVNICDFGAVSDGRTLCTEAFERAITHVHEQGGGTVVVPAGLWYTGPIELLSNVRLHTEYGALVQFTSDLDAYKIIDTSFEGLDTRRCQSPLFAYKAHNIAITGHGTFDGCGEDWRPVKKSKVTSKQWKELLAKGNITNEKGNIWYPSEESRKGSEACYDFNVPDNITTDAEWESIKRWLRPTLLNFIACDTVLLEGATFKNSPAWCLHPLMCSYLTIDKVQVSNPWYAQNGDALDIESCRNVIVTNSTFDAGDDAICIKSGKDEDGRRRAVPCENVIIRNNTVLHGHGGFVVGSEMSGGVRNILISHCCFIGTDVGLRFKSTRGRGGVVENIYINHIVMTNIPEEALLFDLFYGKKGKETAHETPAVSDETPIFRNIHIDNVVCRGAGRAMYFNGLPEMKISDVFIDNVTILKAQSGIVINQAQGIKIEDTVVESAQNNVLNLSNAIDIFIEQLTSLPEATVSIGEGCEKISIEDSNIDKDNIIINESVNEKEIKIK